MLRLFVALLLGQAGSLVHDSAWHVAGGRALVGAAEKAITLRVTTPEEDDSGASDDDSTDLEVVPPVPPVPPIPPIPPVPPRVRAEDRSDGDLPRFTETAKNVPTAEVLHRIASRAGWSMTLVGSPKDRIDVDEREVDPREALRDVLRKSGAMGVLKRDKLVVVASPEPGTAGMLIEQVDRAHRVRRGATRGWSRGDKRSTRDVVRIFQGDVTVKQGEIVQGDVVCVGGSIELEPGSVVQGDAVAVGGSVNVNQGALVLGQAVSVLGDVDVARGAQVMGEHVQIGLGRIFGSSRRHGFLTRLGPFGLFPTVALFALVYLIGLLVLRMWPERVRNVGFAMFENPVRSLVVGFLCWLLLLPLIILLVISIVGIPLIPLLPLLIFLSIVVGLSSFALRIGESLPAGPGQRFVPPAALGMGMVVLLLASFVPWLGVSVLALLQFFALGASVGSRFGRALPPPRV